MTSAGAAGRIAGGRDNGHIGYPPGRDFRTELAVALGFLALAAMCLQFVLTARFRRLKAPLGCDLVYAFHRDVTLAAALALGAALFVLARSG